MLIKRPIKTVKLLFNVKIILAKVSVGTTRFDTTEIGITALSIRKSATGSREKRKAKSDINLTCTRISQYA